VGRQTKTEGSRTCPTYCDTRNLSLVVLLHGPRLTSVMDDLLPFPTDVYLHPEIICIHFIVVFVLFCAGSIT
jgi:hypothetical protein